MQKGSFISDVLNETATPKRIKACSGFDTADSWQKVGLRKGRHAGKGRRLTS
jgi:hypothetical protein